jgi:hypothetical protein
MAVRTDSYVPGPDEIRRAFAESSQGDLVYFMRQCLERGGFDHALAVGEALPERFEEDPALALTLGIARFLGGEREAARAAVAELSARRPDDLNALSVLAEMEARSGHGASAIELFSRLLERYPDYPGAHATLAALLMPGPHYRDVLRAIHARLAPRTYLEIGVAAGATLALAATAEVAVGVDPVDAPLEHALPPAARVVRETSDLFFASRSPQEVFGTDAVDLVFIDGLHVFEQTLRDFFNAEAWCGQASAIVLHDCVPIARATAARERCTRFWVGDTWKVVWALGRARPELRLRTILTPPSGLVVVRRLDPSARPSADSVARLIDELSSLEYPLVPGAWPAELHVLPNTPHGLAEALG